MVYEWDKYSSLDKQDITLKKCRHLATHNTGTSCNIYVIERSTWILTGKQGFPVLQLDHFTSTVGQCRVLWTTGRFYSHGCLKCRIRVGNAGSEIWKSNICYASCNNTKRQYRKSLSLIQEKNNNNTDNRIYALRRIGSRIYAMQRGAITQNVNDEEAYR